MAHPLIFALRLGDAFLFKFGLNDRNVFARYGAKLAAIRIAIN